MTARTWISALARLAAFPEDASLEHREKGAAMQELEATWRRMAAIWWLMMWRGAIGGLLLGSVIGLIAGAIAGFVAAAVFQIPFDQATYENIGRISALVVTIPLGLLWGLLVLRMAVRKKYHGFRIVLIAEPTTQQVMPSS